MRKVLFGGAFDLLHAGHIRAFYKAREFGDYLVVSVLSDERIKAKNGKRDVFKENLAPIIPAKERVEIVRALRPVDEVVCLEGDPDYPVIKLLDLVKPDVLVLCLDEYNAMHVDLSRERSACEERGIELVTIPRIITESGLDSSGIIDKILTA